MATVLQRHETNRKEIEAVEVFGQGRRSSRSLVEKAMNQSDEYDAVVSTIGGTPGGPTRDSQANIALIDAAAAKGARKVCAGDRAWRKRQRWTRHAERVRRVEAGVDRKGEG